MITIPEKNYSKSDISIAGKILKRTSTAGTRNTARRYIQWNYEFASSPDWGNDWEYISANTNPGTIIGKLTGRYNVVGDKYECEVKLFNHSWSQFGVPVMHIDWTTPISMGFYQDPDYSLLADDGTVRGIVSKDHYSRDQHQNFFPHFDPDYFEFSDPEVWDTYFQSPDWTNGESFFGYQHKIPRVKLVGSLNDITGKSAELISVKPHWGGGSLLDWGLCFSSTNPNPDVNDIFVPSPGDKRVFTPRGGVRVYNLIPDTDFFVRIWHKREGDVTKGEAVEVEYYSSPMTIRTAAVLRDPQYVIGAVTYNLTATSAQIRTGFDWIGDYNILEAGLCWATHDNPTSEDNHLTTEVRTELTPVFYELTNLLSATKYYVRTYVKIEGRTVYGTPDLTVAPIRNYGYRHPGHFTTSELIVPLLPTLETLQKFNIYANSAVVSAKVLSANGAALLGAGLCWSKLTMPTVDDEFAEADLSRGHEEEFYVDLTNLEPNTTYYVRAWATTSAGTGYSSNEQVFTTSEGVASVLTIETAPVSEIKTTSVKAGGHIADDGGVPITERGVCWKQSSIPGFATVADNKKTDNNPGVGVYSIQLTGLLVGTAYKLRSYLISDGVVHYGNEVTFTTLAVELTYKPTVSTLQATSISANKATLSGKVITDGGSIITRKGIAWSTSSIPETTTPQGSFSDILSDNFSLQITTLTPNKFYKARAYAINANGISWGNEIQFLTLYDEVVEVPTVEALPVFGMSKTGGVIGGRITSKGGGTLLRCGVSWSVNPLPGIDMPVDDFEDNSYLPDSFSTSLSGLIPNTTYYFRAYAVNEAGISWSEQSEFRTLAENLLPITISNEVLERLSNSILIGVEIGDDDLTPILEKGLAWGFEINRLTNLISYGDYRSSFEATFTQYETGTYYVKAYAINVNGTYFASSVLELKVGMTDNTQFVVPKDPNIKFFNYKNRTWRRNEHGWEAYKTTQTLSQSKPVEISNKADHGYTSGETVKTVKDVEQKIDSLVGTVGGFPPIGPDGLIPEQYVPGFKEAFSAREDFPLFAGDTIYITDKSLPTIINNIFVYVDGVLLRPSTDYTVSGDIITLSEELIEKDVSVVWFLNRNEYYMRPPSKIFDLHTILISNRVVMLEFSAGGAFGNQGTCEKYIVYYSKLAITQLNYKSAKSVEITSGIPTYGVPVICNVSRLEPGSIYHFVVVGVRQGAESEISNVVVTKTIDTNIATSTPQPIKIYGEQVIDHIKAVTKITDNVDSLKEHPYGNYYLAPYAFDANIIGNNGQIHPSTNTGDLYYRFSYMGWKSTWPDFKPYQIVINLEDTIDVTSVFVHYSKGDRINIYTSILGSNFTLAGYTGGYAGLNKWNEVLIPDGLRRSRYIMISFGDGAVNPDTIINEIALFGRRSSNSLPKGIKNKYSKKPPRWEYFAGTCAFFFDTVTDINLFGLRNRYYTQWPWFLTIERLAAINTRLYGDTSGDSQVSYSFSNSRSLGNLDSKLSLLKQSQLSYYGNSDVQTYICIKDLIEFMGQPPGTTMDNWVPFSTTRHYRMEDRYIYPQYSSKDPMAYRFIAQFVFTLAARYGRSTGIDESLMAVDPTNLKLQGLDLVKYIEVENEPNRWWNPTSDTYYHPEQLAAMMSACYDGHMGTLGPGFGIKQADPTMMYVAAGTAGSDTAYWERVLMWFEANRTDPDYPTYAFDVLSVHGYWNNTGGQLVNNTIKGKVADVKIPPGTHGPSRDFYHFLQELTDLRLRKNLTQEIWLGEFGYDETPHSTQAIEMQPNRNIAQLKADALMRGHLHVIAAGLDGIQQYMYRNDIQLSVIYNNGYAERYRSSGYVDYLTERDETGNYIPTGDPRKTPPLTSYFYMRNFMKNMIGMRFSHIVRISGETHSEGVLLDINENDEISKSICALAFVPDDEDPSITKSPCLVLWVGTELFEQSSVMVNINEISSSIRRTEFYDSELHQDQYGFDYQLNILTDGVKNYVDVPISGTPSILWTSSIGRKRIEKPVLKSYVTSSRTARLYWTDKNSENYAVAIYKYNEGLGSYEEIYKDYLSSQEYDVSGLLPATANKLMIKFIDLSGVDEFSSEYSNIVEFTTPAILDPVSNLRQGLISYNKIILEWDYSELQLSLVDGFSVYRSENPTGPYSLVNQISKKYNTYTDYGIAEGSTLYYKVEAFSSIASGDSSSYIATTTFEENFTSPSPVSAKTDYFGERISLFFDIPLSSNIIALDNISVYDSNDGSPRMINPSSIVYDEPSNRLYIYLESKILSSTSTILIGYDGVGILSSKYNIPVNAFYDVPVVNNLNSPYLIESVIQVDLTGDPAVNATFAQYVKPEEETGWNQMISTAASWIENAVDNNGNQTDIVVSTATLRAWRGYEMLIMPMHPMAVAQEIEGFPSWTLGAGGTVSGGTSDNRMTHGVNFHNLRSDREYFIEYAVLPKSFLEPHCYLKEFINHVETQVVNSADHFTSPIKTGKLQIGIPGISPQTITIPRFNSPSLMLGLASVTHNDIMKEDLALLAVRLYIIVGEAL